MCSPLGLGFAEALESLDDLSVTGLGGGLRFFLWKALEDSLEDRWNNYNNNNNNKKPVTFN